MKSFLVAYFDDWAQFPNAQMVCIGGTVVPQWYSGTVVLLSGTGVLMDLLIQILHSHFKSLLLFEVKAVIRLHSVHW